MVGSRNGRARRVRARTTSKSERASERALFFFFSFLFSFFFFSARLLVGNQETCSTGQVAGGHDAVAHPLSLALVGSHRPSKMLPKRRIVTSTLDARAGPKFARPSSQWSGMPELLLQEGSTDLLETSITAKLSASAPTAAVDAQRRLGWVTVDRRPFPTHARS